MSDNVQQTFRFNFDFNRKDVKKQLNGIALDVKEAIAKMGDASDKVAIFKDVVTYLSNVDNALNAFKSKHKDDFAEIFGTPDVDITKILESIFGATQQAAQGFTTLKDKITNAASNKAGLQTLKGIAEEINALYVSVGKTPPIDIEEKFTGKGSKKDGTNFAGRIKLLTDTLDEFGETYSGFQNRLKGGFGAGGHGGAGATSDLDGITKEVQEKINKLKEQQAELQEVLDTINNPKKAKVSLPKQDNEQVDALKSYVYEFKAAHDEIGRLKERAKSGSVVSNEEYLNAAVKHVTAAAKLKKAFDVSGMSEAATYFVGNNPDVYVNAENALKDFEKNQKETLTNIQAMYSKKISAINVEIERLAKPTKNVYDTLKNKLEEYYDLQKQLNDVEPKTPEADKITGKQRAIVDEVHALKQLTEDQESDLYDVFDNIDDGVIKFEDALSGVCNILKVDMPQAMNNLDDSSPFKKTISDLEYVNALAGQLKNMFATMSRRTDFEYNISINGLDVKAIKGDEKKVTHATQVESYLDNLFASSTMYGHSHRGGSQYFNTSDMLTYLDEYKDALHSFSFVVGGDGIQTLDLSKIDTKDIENIKQAIQALGANSNAPLRIDQVNQIVEKITGVKNVLRSWDSSRIDELAQYMYSVAKNTSAALSPMEKFQAILNNFFGAGKVAASKYEDLLSELNADNAKEIFNQIAKSENLPLINNGTSLTIRQVSEDIDNNIKKYQQLREEANLTYEDIKNEVSKVMDHYKNGGGVDSGLDFFRKYFPEGSWQEVKSWLTDACDGLISIEEVQNRLASEFLVDPDTFEKIPNGHGENVPSNVDKAKTKLQDFLTFANTMQETEYFGSDVEIGQYLGQLDAAKKELEELGAQGLLTAEELEKVQSAFDGSKNKLETHVQSKTYSLESLYENGSESAKKAIQEYAELNAEMNEMWAFLNKTSHERPQGFTDPWSQTDEQKAKFINTAKEYQNIIKQINDLEIVANTEDDKNRLIALKKEAIELQRYLQFAVLADGNLESYQRVYGLSQDDARQFMMTVRNGHDTSQKFADQIRQEYENRQDAKISQIEKLNPGFSARMFKDVDALTKMLDKLVATQEKLNSTEAKMALQTLLDITEEIKGKSFPLGDAEGNVEIGRYTERLESARDALLKVAQAGQLTSEELNHANAAFEEASGRLKDYTTHYDGYGSGDGDYEYTYEDEYHNASSENERLRHDLDLSEKQYQDVKEENERLRAELADAHQNIETSVHEEIANHDANADAIRNEADQLERLSKLKMDVGLASLYAKFYDDNADEDPSSFIGQKALEEKEKLLGFLGDNPAQTEDDLKAWAKQLQDKITPVEESVKRISKLSAVPKDLHTTTEMYQEAAKVGQQISNMYDEGITDTEEYIALQHKLLKIFDKIKACYGGVKGSGAKDDFELSQWIYANMKQDTGFDYYSGSLIDALYNAKTSIYDPNTGKKRSMRDMAAGLLEYESDYFYGAEAYQRDSDRLKDVHKILDVVAKRREQLFETPVVDDNIEEDIVTKDESKNIEQTNKSLKEKIGILKEISKAYENMYSAKEAYDEADTPAQEDKAEQKLDAATEAVEELKKQYYSLIVTMQDGSKVDLKLEDDFEEAAESIIANAKRIQDIEIIPGSFGDAIEAYERINFTKDNISEGIKRSWGRVSSYGTTSNSIEYLNRVKTDLEYQINAINQSDPEGKFDFTNACQSAQELLSTINSILPKFEMMAQAEEKINELGITPDESDIYDVVDGVKNGVFTTVDQCVDKIKELTNFADGDITLDTDDTNQENVIAETAQLEKLKDALTEVKQAVDLKTQAFIEEGTTVDSVVQQEIAALDKLKSALSEVRGDMSKKTDDTVLATVYHGSKNILNNAEYDISKSSGRRNLGEGMYVTPDVDLAAKHGKNILKQTVSMDKMFILTKDLITNVDLLYQAMGKIKPEQMDWKTIKADLNESMHVADQAKQFAKTIQDAGYEGIYSKGYGYADENAEQLVIYSEKYRKNLTTIPYSQIQQSEAEVLNTQKAINDAIEKRVDLQKSNVETHDANVYSKNVDAINNEINDLVRLKEMLAEVEQAVQLKTNAFINEGTTVGNVVGEEISNLTQLADLLTTIQGIISEVNASKIDINTDNLSSIVNNASDEKMSVDENPNYTTDPQDHVPSDTSPSSSYALDATLKDTNGILENILRALNGDLSLTQLAEALSSATAELKNVANGIVDEHKRRKVDTRQADVRLADSKTREEIRGTALDAVAGAAVDGGKIDVTDMKAMADGAVKVSGYVQTATDKWEGFTLQVNAAGETSKIAWDANAKVAKEAQKAADEASNAAREIENVADASANRTKSAIDIAREFYSNIPMGSDAQKEALANRMVNKALNNAFGLNKSENNLFTFMGSKSDYNTLDPSYYLPQYEAIDNILQKIGYHLGELKPKMIDKNTQYGFSAEVVANSERVITNLEEAREILFGIKQIEDTNGTSGIDKKISAELDSAKKVRELNKIINQINGQKNDMGFDLNAINMSEDQQAIATQYDKVIDEIDKYNIAVKYGKDVALDGINKEKEALFELIKAYKDKNNIEHGGKTGNKKAPGATVVKNATTKYKALSNMANTEELSGSEVVAQHLKQYTAAYKQLVALQKQYKVGQVLSSEQEQEFNDARVACNNYAKDLEKLLKLYQKGVNDGDASKRYEFDADFQDTSDGRQKAFRDFLDQYDKSSVTFEKFDDNYNKMIYTVNNGDGTFVKMTATINSTRTAIDTVAGEAKEATGVLASFFNELKGKFKSISAYLISSLSIHEVWQQVRRGVEYVKEIDDALTELKKVTDSTNDSYQRFLRTMSQAAGVTGSTVKDLTSSAADWARLNY